MELNEKQKEGLQLAVTRYNQNLKYTVIAGYAGWIKLFWSILF